MRLTGTCMAAAVAVLGCASIPSGRAAVDAVQIQGNDAVDDDEILERLATTPSPKFLGLWSGVVFDYELLDRYVLQKDLARVERFYRARGFYEAHARAGRIEQSANHVRVTIVVEEGPEITVSDVALNGLNAIPMSVAAVARGAAERGVRRGERFDEDAFSAADAAVERALTDQGYAFAKVTRRAQVDLVTRKANVVFDVQPDRPSKFGPVRIEGLGALPDGPVRRALDISEGETFSSAELDRAQQAILDLGVFTSVQIVPELPDPPPANRVVPLTVKVEPTRLHSVTLGGGIELDAIRTEGHLVVGWESLNFLGGMRNFSVRAKPGLVLYPTRLPELQGPTDVLPEGRLQTQLRQPGFLEARTAGLFRAEASEYPILLTTGSEPGQPVIGYREVRTTAGIDRTVWRLYVFPSYNLQLNFPFAYKGELDPALQNIAISYVEALARFDLRDNAVHPRKGLYFGADVQYAGLGGDARDLRVQPEMRVYAPVTRSLTFAARALVGFLFPSNYGDFLGTPTVPPESDRTQWARDIQIGYFRGFFSGGPSSNRGYPLRGVGPHGVVPFFSPGIATQQLLSSCEPDNPAFDPVRCAIPLGGVSLWEASVELRLHVSGPFSTAGFCDTSDVSAKSLTLRFRKPHLSCGAGLRFDTPVGPIRLDVGYRIPGVQTLGPENPIEEGQPGTIFGAPIAVALGIGEAF